MVEDAPGFDEVAEELMGKLEDCVFVAHNVGFDYAFLRGHFEAMDISFRRPKLCTVRLSRKAFPGLPVTDSVRLRRHGHPPHRPTPGARGAEATRCLSHKTAEARDTRAMDAPARARQGIRRAPHEPGVYCSWTPRQTPYIGMSIHIQKRVRSHSHHRVFQRQILMRDMRSLKHELAGSEWMAAVMEDVRIRPLAAPGPRNNPALRSIVLRRPPRPQPPGVRAQQGTRAHYLPARLRPESGSTSKCKTRPAFDLLGLGALVPEETVSVKSTKSPRKPCGLEASAFGLVCERGRTPDERGFIAVREARGRLRVRGSRRPPGRSLLG